MPTERLPLPNGDWVDLVTRVNHAQARRIRTAYRSPELDAITETTAALAVNWSIRDTDGAEVPYPGGGPEGVPSAALDRFPDEAVITVFVRAAEIFNGGPAPNASAGISGDSPQAPASPSTTT
jgi:hypothetical protein